MSSSTEPGAAQALLLFDIDGTLVLSGGAGGRAMSRAFHATFGVSAAFEGAKMAGRTDCHLIADALARAGVPDTREGHARFYDAYLPLLQEEIGRPPTGRHTALPGVPALLARVARTPGAHLALLTGNHPGAAEIKLRHFELWGYFSWGVYGDESPRRDDLGHMAMRRAAEREVPAAARANVVVIGDTPHDIRTARAIGARAIAVATGGATADVLRAEGADVVLDDLGDVERVLALLL